VAVCERNHPLLQPAHPIWRKSVRWTYGWADTIVLQTEASRSAMHESVRSHCIVIANPVTRFERTPEPEGQKRLAAVGRLESQKGFDLLIDAFARVADRHPDWTLKIWGEGPLRADLEDRIKARGLDGQAVLAGLSKGPEGWIRDSSAFVITSEYEGFGNALAEAGAAGLPRVAAWFEFGAREQITDDVDGLLLPIREVGSLAAALDRLMSDRELRRRLGEAAAESGQRFAPARILADWDDLLVRLRGERRDSLPTSE
jgi:glycosyltransferase involved in cell wall biosynthesis